MRSEDEEIVAKAARMYIRQVQFGWLRSGIIGLAVISYLGYQHFSEQSGANHVVSYINLTNDDLSPDQLKRVIEEEIVKPNVASVVVRGLSGGSEAELVLLQKSSDKPVFVAEVP